jgi:thiamine biosynthesis lipoprotein
MGTAVGVDVRDPLPGHVLTEVFDWFGWVDATFSTYREDSALCRYRRGELALDQAPDELRVVLDRCDALRPGTDGAFDHRPGGPALDPSALVKGWSADRAADLLRAAGARSFCVNAGGDVLCSGAREPGQPWRVGIRHPEAAGAVAAVLQIGDGAVATSGSYERGEHVWGRAPGAPAAASVTVVGPELGLADALATAAFAAPGPVPAWWHRFPGYDLLVVTADRQLRWTPGLDGVLATV